MTAVELLKQLERGFKANAAADRQHVALQQFDVFLSAQDDEHLSFSIPHSLGRAGIDEMINSFASKGRRARVEYFHELNPDLASALEGKGFELEMNAPLMTLQRDDLAMSEHAFEYRAIRFGDEGLLEAFFRRQSVAFGGDGGDRSLSWLPQVKEGLGRGSIMVSTVLHEGQPVAGAVIQGRDDGELAGVWTSPAMRRKGYAQAVCQNLLRDYFLTRELCWLSSAENALRLYENLGFKRIGSQRNYRFAGDVA